MKNPADLSQALQALQRETKKDVEEIHLREETRKHGAEENFKLAQDIKSKEEEIRIEEQKIQHLRQEMANDKKKEDENNRLITKAAQEITRLRMESQRASAQLAETEREYREAVNGINNKTTNNNNGIKHY